MAERGEITPAEAVARVLAGSSQLGTGCLVGGGLVLTAEPLASGAPPSVVTTGSPSPRTATVAWTGSGAASGAAVLRVDNPLMADQRGPLVGKLRVDAVALAYNADVAWLPGGPQNPLERIPGTLSYLGRPSGFEFTADAAAWGVSAAPAGLAGAPVWIGDWLIGIVTSVSAGSGRLQGVLVSDLLSDTSFAGLTRLVSENVPEDAIAAAAPQASGTGGGPELSGSTREVIVRAARRAGGQPVDASFVLVSALQYAHDTQLPGITDALLDDLALRRANRLAAGGSAPDELLAELDAALPSVSGSAAADRSLTELIAAPPLSALLARAADNADLLAGHREVHLRHLVAAAVLTDDPPLRPELLRALGVTRDELLSLVRTAAAAETTGEPQDLWQALLRPPPVRLAGGISTDRVDPNLGIPPDQDDLAFGVWASMFAVIIASGDTPMPLSVGVFGAWGAGKSYFMGLLRGAIDRLAGTGPPYLGHVVQIGFNAWHYTDTNLWASLGDEIFRQLAGPSPTAGESREKLRRDLAEAQVQRKELEARTEQAKNETARLQAELRQAAARRQGRARDLLKAIAGSSELKKQLDPVWRRLGVRDEAEQADMLAGQIRGIAQDGRAFRGLLSQRRTWVLAAICLIALLLTVAGIFIPARWGARLRDDGAAGTIALAVTFGLTLAAQVGSGLSRLRAIAADLSRGAARAADERTRAEIGQALDRLSQAEASEKVTEQQLQQVVERVGELARELADLMPGQRLYTFLAERAASGAYTAELGLVSTIRKDFEHLVGLLKDWRDEGGDDDEGGHRRIDRIVLYIDDLDRCRPEQVVEVLQAVHLLLALDLFVVVVGVDPRWLMRSLRQQYHGILDDTPRRPGQERVLVDVTPVDYLEKIFNLPFVLPELRRDGLEHLIRRLSASSGDDGTAGDDETPAAGDAPRAVPVPTPLSQPAEAIAVQAGSQIAAANAENGGEPPRPLTGREIELLAALEPFISTPRDAKRMFNLYRMLRSTRDLSDASDFLGDEDQPGEFQAVAVLLAMMTADAHLLQQVLDAPPDPKQGIAGGLTSWPSKRSWPDFAAALVPETAANRIIGPIPPEEADAWRRLADAARATARFVSLADLTAFLTWAPRIRRFSYLLSPLNYARPADEPPAAGPPAAGLPAAGPPAGGP